jgi:zinc transport system ATP-binding protein
MPLVQMTDVTVQYGTTTVLDAVSCQIVSGEIVSLIGPNGAGKTTFIRVILDLIKPASGQIQRAAPLKFGYVPQKLALDKTLPLSVERFLQLSQAATKTTIEAALTELGVLSLKRQALQTLSGGELQRVLLARALLRTPDLLVLDEPAQGVDIQGQAALYALIQRVRDNTGCGVLLVSHDLHLVMAATDTVICLNRHVCCMGHPESIQQDPAYLTLFGFNGPSAVTAYQHRHNHSHEGRHGI